MFKIGTTKGIENDIESIVKHFKNRYKVEVDLRILEERIILVNNVLSPLGWRINRKNIVENKLLEVLVHYASTWGWSIFVPHSTIPNEIWCFYKYKVTARDHALGWNN